MDSLLSGSIAGIVADVATHPLGTVKTRLQVQGASASSLTRYGGVAQGLTRILTKEGVGALYKGVGVVVATAAPAQGLFFLGNDSPRPPAAPARGGRQPAGRGSLRVLCWVPMDTVKEGCRSRASSNAGPRRSSAGRGTRCGRSRGGKGWGLPGVLGPPGDVRLNGLFFAIYEACKDAGVHGLGSGVVAARGGLPHEPHGSREDQTPSGPHGPRLRYAGAFDCVGQILRREGLPHSSTGRRAARPSRRG